MKYAVIDATGRPTAFYSDDVHATIPENAVQISDADWQTFLSDQSAYKFVNGKIAQKSKTIAERKAVLFAELTAKRIEKTESGVPFGGKTVPTDKDALVMINSAVSYLGNNPGKTFKRAGLGEFNAAQLTALQTAIGNMQAPIYARESDLFDAITAAKTHAELDAIDLNAGW